MNYRHIYHAGNLADVVKHLTLAHLLARLTEKPSPLCVMDTHAGIGLYDLAREEAKKTQEAESGVEAFLRLPANEIFFPYLAALKHVNPDGMPPCRFYPGSPTLIRRFLRPDDRLIAIEKHEEDAAALRRYVGSDAVVQLHQRDAWEAMLALIPPPQKRVLVFIDPPYEAPDEMQRAGNAIATALARMAHATVALWYPIKDVVAVGNMQEALANSGITKILRADIFFYKDITPERLSGCGMLIINPPWQFGETLRMAYAALQPLFERDAKPAIIDWLPNPGHDKG